MKLKTFGKAVLMSAAVLMLMSSCNKDEDQVEVPEVYTASVSDIGESSAVAEGSVINNGGGEIQERGFVLSNGPTPTVETGIKRLSGTGTGSYSSTIDGLLGGTNYYLRAFATNEAGTGYGNSLQFTTLELISITFNGFTLAVHPEDNAIYSPWGIDDLVGATSEGYGFFNTQAAAGSSVSANKICNDLNAFGYNNWYLPAIDELVAIFEEQELWGNFYTSTNVYWSSTETSASAAMGVNFETGEVIENAKGVQNGCRCIRRP